MGNTDNAKALINQTLRSRIMVTYALCAVAESEVHAGQLESSLQIVKTIRRMLSDINVLVSGPMDRLSLRTIHEAAEMLSELEIRTQANRASPWTDPTVSLIGTPV